MYMRLKSKSYKFVVFDPSSQRVLVTYDDEESLLNEIGSNQAKDTPDVVIDESDKHLIRK